MSEITAFAPSGANNESIESAYLRIMEGGTWRKARTVWITPASDTMSTKVAFSQMSVFPPPNQPFTRILALGDEVGVAYNKTIEAVLSHPELKDWEYILTVEHDNTPPADGLVKLIKAMEAHPEYACIGGLYWTKGHGGAPQIWGDPKDPVLNFRPMPPDPDGGIVECNGTGMGFNLWRVAMFKDERIARPWFKTKASKEEGVGTQDLAFWSEARKYGYRCAVDCSVLVGHYDAGSGITW